MKTSSLSDLLHVDPATPVQGLGGDPSGNQSHRLDNPYVNLDSVLRIHHPVVRVESDGGGFYVRRVRVSDVARADSARVPVHDYAVVSVGAA